MGSKFCILEKRLPLKTEVSVIVARGLDGSAVTFPVFENHHKNGILAETVVPARVPQAVADKARAYAEKIAHPWNTAVSSALNFLCSPTTRLLPTKWRRVRTIPATPRLKRV